jgi:hypothetical protein
MIKSIIIHALSPSIQVINYAPKCLIYSLNNELDIGLITYIKDGKTPFEAYRTRSAFFGVQIQPPVRVSCFLFLPSSETTSDIP